MIQKIKKYMEEKGTMPEFSEMSVANECEVGEYKEVIDTIVDGIHSYVTTKKEKNKLKNSGIIQNEEDFLKKMSFVVDEVDKSENGNYMTAVTEYYRFRLYSMILGLDKEDTDFMANQIVMGFSDRINRFKKNN